LYLSEEGRYYLPIPKLNPQQMGKIRDELRGRGFSVTGEQDLRVVGRESRFSMTAAGLAWSSVDLLDQVVPSLLNVLVERRTQSDSNPYFVSRAREPGFEIHFFPRMESLKRWNSLRREGLSGLTPDEAHVLTSVLGDSKGSVECITDYPTEGASQTQYGRRFYFRSTIQVSEFLLNLRTISHAAGRNSYLPRSSVIRITDRPREISRRTWEELGEWCFVEHLPKSSNSAI